jgi:hypothetical protein
MQGTLHHRTSFRGLEMTNHHPTLHLEIDLSADELDAVIWAIEDAMSRDSFNLRRHERQLTRKEALRKIRAAVEAFRNGTILAEERRTA